MRQAETAQGAPDRHAMHRHLVLIGSFQHQIIQREISVSATRVTTTTPAAPAIEEPESDRCPTWAGTEVVGTLCATT